MKKFFKLTFTLVLLFTLSLCFRSNVSADDEVVTPTITTKNGASIRLTEPNGLRFVANVAGDFGSDAKYYFAILKGEKTRDEMISRIEAGTTALADCTLVDGEFSTSIVGIPATDYARDISVLPFVLVNGERIYSDTEVTRNIYEVAVAAKNDTENYPEGGIPFIDNLVKTVTLEMNGGNYTHKYEFTITGNGNADYVIGGGKTINFASKAKYGNACNGYWTRLYVIKIADTDYYKAVGTGAPPTDYDYVIAAHSGCTDVTSRNTLVNLCADSKLNNYYIKFDLPTSSSASCNVKVTVDEYNGTELQLENGATLPTIAKDYYDFGGWYDNAEFEGTPVTTHTAGKLKYYAKFTPTSYTITYELDGGSFSGTFVNVYNIESDELVLPTTGLTINGGTFAGWYAESSFITPITSIPTGSHGDKEIYAKWNIPSYDIDLTSDAFKANANALATNTPDIIVGALNQSVKFKFVNGTNSALAEKVYETGKTHFSTVADAVAAATNGDLIYVFPGTYSTAFTLNKQINFIGPNAGKLGNASNRSAEAKISGLITLTASNVTFDGFEMKNQVKVTANVQNFNYINNVQSGITADGSIYSSNYTMKNVNISGNYCASYAGARWFYLGTVENLTSNYNYLIGSNCTDYFRVEQCLYGNAEIVGNHVENSKQSIIMISGVGALNLLIKDNYFKNAANTYVDTRGLVAAHAGNVRIDIIHNTFDAGACSWYCIRPRSVNYGTNTLDVQVHYNAFINKCSAGNVYCNNPASGKIYNCDNNYFQEVKAANLTDANFNNSAKSYKNCYDSIADLEAAYQASLNK